MRDYSFGNFISALRMRAGLSQYQLGALVGVSDKAVSKWENGVSKPRTDTIIKLAEVLNVSVDELLTCEYVTFEKERKDLFAMELKIFKLAESKLKEIYGDNPPMKIVNRYKTEKMLLARNEQLRWMGFLGRLQEVLSEKNVYFEVRGIRTGASFIAWLLGGTNTNPLPAHYYCPVCKKIEFAPKEKCGIDLPDKICACGTEFQKDGFGLDVTNIFPLQSGNEIYTTSDTGELVKHCLQEYFDGYGFVREIKIVCGEEIDVPSAERLAAKRYVILPFELEKQYPDEIIKWNSDEYFHYVGKLAIITVVENPEEQITYEDMKCLRIDKQLIEKYFQHILQSGKINGYVSEINLSKEFSNLKGPKFNDLLAIFGFLHSTGAWKNNAEHLYREGIPLDQLISSKEDLNDFLYEKLENKYRENPMGQAYELREATRKGKYAHYGMPKEIEDMLRECDVPEWYIDSMKKIMYLFSKTHNVVLLKRDICNFVKSNN